MQKTFERKPWERLSEPGKNGARESTSNYAVFCEYYSMGRGRSLAKVAAKLKINIKQLERWSVNFSWRQRAEAWDTVLLEAVNAELEKMSIAEISLRSERKKQIYDQRVEWYGQLSRLIRDGFATLTLSSDNVSQPGGIRSKSVRPLIDSLGRLVKLAEELSDRIINGDNGIEIQEIDNYDNVIPFRPTGDKHSGEDESDDNVWDDDDSNNSE